MELDKTYLDNALDFLKKIPSNSIDLILTDPAYNSLNKWLGIGTTARMGMGKEGSGSDDRTKFFETISDDDLPDLIQEFYRVLKPERHCYIFSDWDTLRLLYQFAVYESVFPGRKVSGVWVEPFKPLIWDKMDAGMGYTYRCRHEYIAFLWKGKKRRLNDLGISDVFSFKRVPPSQSFVPTQKPDGLFELLVSQSTQPGELVLDVFMGSGTTARACRKLGRSWLGCDTNEKHVKFANESVNVKETTASIQVIKQAALW
jgi:site-specific DNA-methyltransferase (adenine-specific)